MLFERTAASCQRDQKEEEEQAGTPIDVDQKEQQQGQQRQQQASTSSSSGQTAEPNPDVRDPPPSSHTPPFEYRYLTEFQSHEPEFDYLKSLEIEEKINKVRWARRNVAGSSTENDNASTSSSSCSAGSANGRLLLSTNDKTIKLWRVYDRRVVTLAGFNTARGALGGSGGNGVVGLPPIGNDGGGSGGRDDLIGVGRMPPVAAGAGDGTREEGERAETTTAAVASANPPPPPPGTTPWSIAASARSAEARAPRPPPQSQSQPPPSPPTCEAEDERIGNKIKAFGITSDAGEEARGKAPLPPPPPPPPSALLTLPRAVEARAVLSARCRRTFAGAHAFHVNSLSMCSDGETFLSADDLRVQLWHLDAPPREGSGGRGGSGRTDRSRSGGEIDDDDDDGDGGNFSPKASTSSSSPFFFSVGTDSPAVSSSKHSPAAATPYVIVDMKPACMDDLTEVITSAEFHPSDCALFCHASSKGIARVCDMRSAALCDRPALALEPPGLSSVGEGGNGSGGENNGRSFFSEITASLSDARWCGRDGRALVTRDYLNLTLWDLAMPGSPVAVYPIHDCLRPRLADLYENDCVFDKFGVAVSGDGRCAASGTYSSLFRVVPGPGDEASSAMGNGARVLSSGSNSTRQVAPGLLLEASRDPRRKRALAAAAGGGGEAASAEGAAAANAALGPPPGLGRFGLAPTGGGGGAPPSGIRGGPDDDSAEAVAGDLTAKMLHLAWHPGADVIAAAASNSLYLYYRG